MQLTVIKTINRCLELLEARSVRDSAYIGLTELLNCSSPSINTVDITGGAPELNPHFRTLVQEVSFLLSKIASDSGFAWLTSFCPGTG